jgi:hypothetical protein
MSKIQIINPEQALALFAKQMLDIKIFHHGRRRFSDLP